jgi:exonuclease VII small subunit
VSPDPDVPVALPFGAAYDRLQEVAAELGQDATMAPDRLIALLREGKGLERALRDHLERVEQEVRAIEDGDGAVPFRIVDAAPAPVPAGAGATRPSTPASPPAPAAAPSPPSANAAAPVPSATPEPAAPPEPSATPEPAAPPAPRRAADAPEADRPRAAEPVAPPEPRPAPQPPVAPTLGFPGADDDIPF